MAPRAPARREGDVAVFQLAWQEKGKSRTQGIEARTLAEAIEKLKAERPRAKHVRGTSTAGSAAVRTQ